MGDRIGEGLQFPVRGAEFGGALGDTKLQCGVHLPQRGLGRLERVDVGVGAQHAQRPAVRGPLLDLSQGQDPFPAPVPRAQSEFDAKRRLAAREVVLQQARNAGLVFGVEPFAPRCEGLAEIGRVVAEHDRVLGTHGGFTGFQVEVVQPLTGCRQGQAQPFFAVVQGHLRGPSTTDVEKCHRAKALARPESGNRKECAQTFGPLLELPRLACQCHPAVGADPVRFVVLDARQHLRQPLPHDLDQVQTRDIGQMAVGGKNHQIHRPALPVLHQLKQYKTGVHVLEQGAVAGLGLDQPLLGLRAFGDVARNAEGASDVSLGIAQRPLGGQKYPSPLRRVQVLLVGLHTARRQHPPVDAPDQRRLLGRESSPVVLAEQGAGGTPHIAGRGVVDQQVASLLVLGEDGVAGTLGDGGEQLQGPGLFFRLGLFAPMGGVQPPDQPADQHIQQQGGDDDEEPALEHAGLHERLGVVPQQAHRAVRQQDPETGKRGIHQRHTQGTMRQIDSFVGCVHWNPGR